MSDQLEHQVPLPYPALGHYELVAHIGQGGMGDVYLAYERALDRQVALKVLPLELAENAEFVRRFRAEAAAAARLVHPNIIPIYYIGEDQGRLFFTMQYVAGESLETRLARERRLSAHTALSIVEQVLSGLGAAHRQGLVHRDVKPGNILLDRVSGQALIADFGLVKGVGSGAQERTATGMILGTADYMAPEQARGQSVDARSDLYALGVVLYRMLEGRLPFAAESPLALSFKHVYESPSPMTSAPASLAAVVDRLLAKPPEERYQTAESALNDLRAARAATGQPPPFVIRAPALDLPALPQPVLDARAPGRWELMKDRALSVFRRHAPRVLQHLQNTQQQADGSVREYEQRRQGLARLEEEARAALEDLRALLAARGESGPPEDEILRQIAVQERELDAIRSRLAQVQAILATVRNQRDILQARLRVAQLYAGGGASAGRRRFRWVALSACGAALAVLSASYWIHHESLPKNANAGNQEASNSAAAIQEVHIDPPLATRVVEQPQFSSTSLPARVVSLGFREQTRLVTVVCDDGSSGVWDTAAGPTVPLQGATATQPASIAGGRDGGIIAAVGGETPAGPLRLLVWKPSEEGEPSEVAALSSRTSILSVSPQSIIALQTGESATDIVRWDPIGRQEVSRRALPHRPNGLKAVNAEGSIFATVDDSGKIVAYGLDRDKSTDLLDSSTCAAAPTALTFHPLKPLLAMGTEDGRVVLRDVRQGRQIFEIREQEGAIRALEFDARGRRLAVASRDRVRVWDLGLDYVRLVLSVAGAGVLAFNADGTALATSGSDGVVRIWNTEFEQFFDFLPWLMQLAKGGPASVIERLPEPASGDRTRAVTKDRRLAIVRRVNGTAYIEDARTLESVCNLGSLSTEVVAISANGHYAATGHALGFYVDPRFGESGVKLWDLRDRGPPRQLTQSNMTLGGLVFSPDESLLISRTIDTIEVWSAATGQKIREFRAANENTDYLSISGYLSISPDSRRFVAYSRPVGVCLAEAARVRNYRQVLFDLDLGPVLEFVGCWPDLIFAPRDVLFGRGYGTLERTVLPVSDEHN